MVVEAYPRAREQMFPYLEETLGLPSPTGCSMCSSGAAASMGPDLDRIGLLMSYLLSLRQHSKDLVMNMNP